MLLRMLGLYLYTLYPYNRSQLLQYVKYTKINIAKEIVKFCDK